MVVATMAMEDGSINSSSNTTRRSNNNNNYNSSSMECDENACGGVVLVL